MNLLHQACRSNPFQIDLNLKRLTCKAAVILLLASLPALVASAQTLEGTVATEKETVSVKLVPHPLSWWTKNPLRLDSSDDLMVGYNAADGRPLTAADYGIEVKVIPVGTLAGRKILELRTIFHPGPRVIAAGWAQKDAPPPEWKDLLVPSGADGMFIDIYAVHYDQCGLIKLEPAAVFGTGPDAFLGTFDPTTGNGGSCLDGYWWFDNKGAHAVDFSPLFNAITRAIPANGTFERGCYALHPKSMELDSGVQSKDASCHACDQLGEVDSVFRIEQGIAKPVSVKFEPEKP